MSEPNVIVVRPAVQVVRVVDAAPTIRVARQPALTVVGTPGLQGTRGLPGFAEDASPVSKAFSFVDGQLMGVLYADGRSKALVWAGDRPTRVDTLRTGQPTMRADLSYNPDGTLSAVAQTVI